MSLTAVGQVAVASFYGSDGAVVATCSHGVSAGDVLVAIVAKDNTQTVANSSPEFAYVHDSSSNTWTKAVEYEYTAGSVADGAAVAIYFCNVANALTTSSTITAGFYATVAAAGITVYHYNSNSGPIKLLGTPQLTTSTVQDPGSLTISGLSTPPRPRLFIRATGIEINRDYSANTAGFTNFGAAQAGSGATGVSAVGEFLISSATSATSSPAFSTASNYDSASIFLVFEEGVSIVGGSATLSQGTVKAAVARVLTSGTITGLSGTITGRVITANPSPYNEGTGFAGSDLATVTWAGDAGSSKAVAVFVGMMGMF